VAFFNGVNEMPVDVQMKWYDVWGTEQTYNHMSAGWSWAFDTPFDWFKQNASRLGGINQNMVVSWPARIKDKGGLREQFMHVIDVVPTILEAAGIKAPEMVDGIKQAPIEGTSFAYTFDAANAKVAVAHKTQYFEMMGQWALYDDGWLLSTKVNRAPWEAFGAANPDPLNNQVFQLYNLNKDFSQSRGHRRASTRRRSRRCARSSSPRRRSTRSSRWMRRWRRASSRRARTSPPGAPSSSTPGRWSACRRAIRRSC
jgi:arylsulfatase A-like enzyme